MRVLRFNVNGQIITKSPNCDFDNIVPGSSGYLKAEFTFSSEWQGFIKAASFFRNGKKCPAVLLNDGKSCVIPAEALTGRRFSISITGKNKKDVRMTTNTVEVVQNGG